MKEKILELVWYACAIGILFVGIDLYLKKVVRGEIRKYDKAAITKNENNALNVKLASNPIIELGASLPYVQYDGERLIEGSEILTNSLLMSNNVVFFDYRCGFCKADHDLLEGIMKAQPGEKFFFVMTPILGERSVAWANYVANHPEGEFYNRHTAVMKSKVSINDLEGFQTNSKKMANHNAVAEFVSVNSTPYYLLKGEIHRGSIVNFR